MPSRGCTAGGNLNAGPPARPVHLKGLVQWLGCTGGRQVAAGLGDPGLFAKLPQAQYWGSQRGHSHTPPGPAEVASNLI